MTVLSLSNGIQFQNKKLKNLHYKFLQHFTDYAKSSFGITILKITFFKLEFLFLCQYDILRFFVYFILLKEMFFFFFFTYL
jgi:hypothetical protein